MNKVESYPIACSTTQICIRLRPLSSSHTALPQFRGSDLQSALIMTYTCHGEIYHVVSEHACALSRCHARSHTNKYNICDWIWENPPYGIRARFVQCAFLVAQVEIYRSPNIVIYMSNNPSDCCRLLRRLVVLYEGEINLHFDSAQPPYTEPVAMGGN